MPTRVPRFRQARLRPASLPESRPNAASRGYCDKRHFAWRLAVLTRDGWRCRRCSMLCTKKGEAHADHISPVVAGSDRCVNGVSRYDVAGGQCLCAHCHQKKTNAESRA